jgi:hypothetical protein
LRHDFNQPIMFSPANPHELLLGYQFLMSSTDGGRTWHKLGPDLTFPKGYVAPKPEAKKPEPKKEPTKAAATKNSIADEDADDQNLNPKDAMERAQEMMDDEQQGGVGGGAISSLSPSSINGGVIWAGMSRGTIKLTKDHGKNWDDVDISGNRRSIACVDSSHTDPATAYVVLANEAEPLVYRTKDFGKSWTKIVAGLPANEVTGSGGHVIRADTKKDGLLFLGTESSMYVSFDDGDHWQSLRLNLPNTSYRDMVIKDNDLVVGTYGRSFWILDDLSPLRQVASNLGSAYLFAPGDAVRARRNVSQDTPMPPEVPHSLNAPPGALIYYFLGVKPTSDVTLDVADGSGNPVRHYSSAPLPPLKEPLQPLPDFWKEVPKPLPAELGTNRMNWDLRYDNPPAFSHGYDISATPFLTPTSPQGPLVLPGTYTVTLTVDGRKFTQKVKVTNDPRSPASARDLSEQHEVQMTLYRSDVQAMAGIKALSQLRDKISELRKGKLSKEIDTALDVLNDKLSNLGKTPGSTSALPPSFNVIQGRTISYLAKIEFGDFAPAQPVRDAVTALAKDLETLTKAWAQLQEKDVKELNSRLEKAGLQTLPTAAI